MSMTEYQNSIFQSRREYDFEKIARMMGSCHDALIGEWINWWLSQNASNMIINPARASKSGSQTFYADLLFLEQFEGIEPYEVKGVAEIENNEEKLMTKIDSLRSYETHKSGVEFDYPNLSFALFCYTLNLPNDDLTNRIWNRILEVSKDSHLLWVVCQIDSSSLENSERTYSVFMPNYVKGTACFFDRRNFCDIFIYGVKNGEQVTNFVFPK